MTVAESSTVLEHKQQSCVVQNWKCGTVYSAVRKAEMMNVQVNSWYLLLLQETGNVREVVPCRN